MSGVEVAGLALGVFPVVIELIRSYREVLTGRDAQILLECLRTNEYIFRDSIELMLRSIVPAEADVLLHDLGGNAWKDPSLKDKINLLGQDDGAILRSIEDIYRTLSKLRQKLPNPDTAALNFAARSKLVLKSFAQGSNHKASVERLRTSISDLRILIRGACKLAPYRTKLHSTLPSPSMLPSELKDLELVRECVCGLYDALQAGWNCDSGDPHPTNIKLDIWSFERSPTNSLTFSLLCADHSQKCHGVTAETTPGSSQGGRSSHRINDLCTVLNTPELSQLKAPRRRLGSISTDSGLDYKICSEAGPKHNSKTGKLTEFLGSRGSLDLRTRVQLALKLAWAVLQMSSTVWLEGKWIKENVLVDLATPGDPLAYISHRFQSRRHSSLTSTLAPTTLDMIAAWVDNVSFFALGVFILEMCHNRSIEEMAMSEEKRSMEFQPILTAKRLAKTAPCELGIGYAQAVDACLKLPPAPKTANDYSRFAGEVLQKIIDPLEKTANILFGL